MLGCTIRIVRRREVEQPPGFHAFQANQPVEKGIGQFSQHVLIASPLGTLSQRVVTQQGFDTCAHSSGLCRERHRIDGYMFAIRPHSQTIERGGKVLFKNPTDLGHPRPNGLFVLI
jgi:hypothetical protein